MRYATAVPQTPSVMIADANGTSRVKTRSHLDGQGFRIIDVGTGDETIDLVESDLPDVLLLDPDLTTSDGENVLDVIAIEAGDAMPLVVLTSDDMGQIESGISRGAYDHVSQNAQHAIWLARVNAAIELKRLRAEVADQRSTLARLTRVDALTGLVNRVQTEVQLRQTAATAARHGRPLSIVMLDVDRFSNINLVAGNEAGDMVLQDLARHVMADIRNGDIAGRWDGDQFMLILPETDGLGAAVLAERLRLTISEFGAELPDGNSRPISASFGCVQGSDADEMVRLVTSCVTQAKRSGGNTLRTPVA